MTTGRSHTSTPSDSTPGQFVVEDDRHIVGVTLGSEIDSGMYRVGVRHPIRQIRFARDPVDFSAPGTIKIGDFRFRWAPRWAASRASRFHVPFVILLGVLGAGLIALVLTLSTRRLVSVTREGAMLRAEVLALLEGRPPLLAAEDRARKIRALERRGIGLAVKFSLLVSLLAIVIVAGVSVSLGVQMISRERRILADELVARANLLIDSAAARAVTPLRAGSLGYAAIANIPASVSLMTGEALYLTVTGPGDPMRPGALPEETSTDRDYLLASNDPAWTSFAVTPGREPFGEGAVSSERVRSLATALNADVGDRLRAALDDVRIRSDEVERRAASLGSDPGEAELASYYALLGEYAKVQADARASLLEIAKEPGRSGSEPVFDPDRLVGEYLFYRPIVDLDRNGKYFQGLVRLTVTTQRIQAEIASVTEDLVRVLLIVSLAAVSIGIGGAIVLARITVRPVKRLAAGVARIRDTEDKAELQRGDNGRDPGRDRDAGRSVNEMTRGLVRAAEGQGGAEDGQGRAEAVPAARGGGSRGKGQHGRAETDAARYLRLLRGREGGIGGLLSTSSSSTTAT